MTASARTILARRRILKSFPRPMLDDIAEVERPWGYSRPELESVIAEQWPQAEIETAVLTLVQRASGAPNPHDKERRG